MLEHVRAVTVYGLGVTHLSGVATSKRGSLASASGEVGKHLVITATEVVDRGVATAAHVQRFNAVGRMKGETSATSAKR